ncbi:MAG: dienelactone hydrolase family protein [Actinomycetia bacterium]|nr:dienelactone hydrolase family protein [Actinomycetes bacterium]MCP4222240.1 dienelactone hydrolase family protein [Actinomycetes bacterium]MCP5032947.1 dienelactone hydrolase family protein [Actinomycetes bacterium]
MSAEPSPFTNRRAGEAFLVDPPGGKQGPGVLVLHSWWGLNDWVRDFCRRLAAEGYTVLAPDMFDGVQPVTEPEGEAVLAGLDPDELSGLVMSSAHTLRAMSDDANQPIAIVGFSMGASLAFWLSARMGTSVNAAVAFYGAQSIDFDDASAVYQGHFAEDDHIVSDEDRVVTESFIRLGGRDTEFHVYPGTRHWFFEAGPNHDPEAAELAWTRTVSFLASRAELAV